MSQLSTGSSQLSVSSQRNIRMKSTSVLGCLRSPDHSSVVCRSKCLVSDVIGQTNSQATSGASTVSDLRSIVGQDHGKTADLHQAAVPVSFNRQFLDKNIAIYTHKTLSNGSSTARGLSHAMDNDNIFSDLQSIADGNLASSSPLTTPEIGTIRRACANPTLIGAARVNQTSSSREMSLFRKSGSLFRAAENSPPSTSGVTTQNAVSDFVNLMDIPIAYYGVIS